MSVSLSPIFTDFLKRYLPMPNEAMRLEFYDRLCNLCERSGQNLSPELNRWIEQNLGLDMLRIIQDYSSFSLPKLSPDNLTYINRVIPRVFQAEEINMEFRRLFARQCCESICLTVASENELPNPPEGCEFALVRNLGAEGFAIGLFFWEPVSSKWESYANAAGTYVSGEISQVDYDLDAGWSVTLNGGVFSGEGSNFTVFDPAVDTLDVVFTNGACVYTMDQIVAPGLPLILEWDNIANAPVSNPEDVEEWNVLFGFASNFLYVSVAGNFVSLYASDPFTLPTISFQSNQNIIGVDDQGGYITASEGLSFFQTTIDYFFCASISVIPQEMFRESAIRHTLINPTGIGSSAFASCVNYNQNGNTVGLLNFPAFSGFGGEDPDQVVSIFSQTAATEIRCNALTAIPRQFVDGNPNLETLRCQAALQFITFGAAPALSNAINSCPSLVLVDTPLAVYGDPDNNSIFNDTGLTLTVNCAAENQTSDGGNPDGDLVWLAANNTATINYI